MYCHYTHIKRSMSTNVQLDTNSHVWWKAFGKVCSKVRHHRYYLRKYWMLPDIAMRYILGLEKNYIKVHTHTLVRRITSHFKRYSGCRGFQLWSKLDSDSINWKVKLHVKLRWEQMSLYSPNSALSYSQINTIKTYP